MNYKERTEKMKQIKKFMEENFDSFIIVGMNKKSETMAANGGERNLLKLLAKIDIQFEEAHKRANTGKEYKEVKEDARTEYLVISALNDLLGGKGEEHVEVREDK